MKYIVSIVVISVVLISCNKEEPLPYATIQIESPFEGDTINQMDSVKLRGLISASGGSLGGYTISIWNLTTDEKVYSDYSHEYEYSWQYIIDTNWINNVTVTSDMRAYIRVVLDHPYMISDEQINFVCTD